MVEGTYCYTNFMGMSLIKITPTKNLNKAVHKSSFVYGWDSVNSHDGYDLIVSVQERDTKPSHQYHY